MNYLIRLSLANFSTDSFKTKTRNLMKIALSTLRTKIETYLVADKIFVILHQCYL